MKGTARKTLEGSRPDGPAADRIRFCLKLLYDDRTKTIDDEVVGGLNFEELIGALLLGPDLACSEE